MQIDSGDSLEKNTTIWLFFAVFSFSSSGVSDGHVEMFALLTVHKLLKFFMQS